MLAGMKVTPPAVMADLSCDACHDLSKPSTTPVAAQCDTCHEKGYGEMVQTWKSDAQATRAKASAAIEELRKSLGSGRPGNAREQNLQQLVNQLQGALEQVDRAGPQHNTELADAVYQQIIKLAAEPTVLPRPK
jgi:transcription initiation factor TFIIIB Brf1 subunit/transcription initiation factor TFIIB